MTNCLVSSMQWCRECMWAYMADSFLLRWKSQCVRCSVSTGDQRHDHHVAHQGGRSTCWPSNEGHNISIARLVFSRCFIVLEMMSMTNESTLTGHCEVASCFSLPTPAGQSVILEAAKPANTAALRAGSSSRRSKWYASHRHPQGAMGRQREQTPRE
jgi:hypothetical protein